MIDAIERSDLQWAVMYDTSSIPDPDITSNWIEVIENYQIIFKTRNGTSYSFLTRMKLSATVAYSILNMAEKMEG